MIPSRLSLAVFPLVILTAAIMVFFTYSCTQFNSVQAVDEQQKYLGIIENGLIDVEDAEIQLEADTSALLWPIESGMGRITQNFGPVNDAWFHSAIDIAALRGIQIQAAAMGIVKDTGFKSETVGNYVIVEHPGGLYTAYSHMDDVNVTAGQKIEKGEALGTLGNTGKSTGPHLHFAVSHTTISFKAGEGFQSIDFIDPMTLITD